MCTNLKIHEKQMQNSQKEVYLGDIVHYSGIIKHTVEARVCRGYGIVSEVMSILEEIPLGRHKTDMALKLREAKLVGGMLHSSEAWHDFTLAEAKLLEKVDEHLLRSVLSAHPKTPLEFLYLETGALPIRYIIMSRRLIYLQTLLCRDDEELTKRVLNEQEKNPTEGDFILMVKDDFEKIKVPYDRQFIESAGKKYKEFIKQKVREYAYSELKNLQESHSKVKEIEYKKLETQKYIKSAMLSNEEVYLLAALRSHTVRGIKMNSKSLYQSNPYCPLECNSANESALPLDSLFECPGIVIDS